MAEQSFIEKCYKDKHGKITIAELPNLPLIVWLVTMILSKVVSTGTLHNAFSIISFGALFTWTWLELFSGSNYLRRILGLVVLVMLIQSRI